VLFKDCSAICAPMLVWIEFKDMVVSFRASLVQRSPASCGHDRP